MKSQRRIGDRRRSDRRATTRDVAVVPRIFVFAALVAWCSALLFVRMLRTHSLEHMWLMWNLLLAIIPLFAAAMFARARRTTSQAIWFVVWLLFLPNAPYIVTDFIHLAQTPRVPLWFDIAMFTSFAATGLLLAYSSLDDIRMTIAQRFGVATSWIVAFTALLLSGFGIYLGRFVRLNTWDVLLDPLGLATYIGRGVVNPLSHQRTIAVTLIYGVGLVVGYLAYQLPRLRTS